MALGNTGHHVGVEALRFGAIAVMQKSGSVARRTLLSPAHKHSAAHPDTLR